jgi:hypothetical protein
MSVTTEAERMNITYREAVRGAIRDAMPEKCR